MVGNMGDKHYCFNQVLEGRLKLLISPVTKRAVFTRLKNQVRCLVLFLYKDNRGKINQLNIKKTNTLVVVIAVV